jgi:DNA-binding beta-propeller fold protein YncE
MSVAPSSARRALIFSAVAHNFHSINTKKGTNVTPTEHTAKTPSLRTGIFATLRGLLRVGRTGAPSSARLGARRPARLTALHLLAAALATTALLALTAAPALASTSYTKLGEITGPAAGETFERLKSESVAVSDKNGHVYVADSGRHRVYDFASASATTPEAVWDGTTTPAGEFKGNLAVAVDNTSGDVYVADSAAKVIEKFDPNGSLITTFGDTTPAANGQLAGLKTPAGSFSPPEQASFGIAVDQGTHDLYVIDAGNHAVDVFDESGAFRQAPSKALAEGLPAAEAEGLFNGPFECGSALADGIAVDDASSELLVSDSCAQKAFRFGLATGSFVSAINGSETPAGNLGGRYTSVTADNSSGRIYLNDTGNHVVDAFRSDGTYTNSQILEAPAAETFSGLAVDQATHDVYVADNGGESRPGAVKVFAVHTSKPGPSVDAVSASLVTATSATLEAELNPEESPTTYRFEYDTSPYAEGEAPHGTRVPVPDGSAGAEGKDVTRSVQLEGLSPATVYHYRVVASNSLGTVEGADQTFTTQAAAGTLGSSFLPDGRAWEMVSPPEKDGIPLEGLAEQGADIQAAADGSGIAYVARGPINGGAPGSHAPAWSQLLSRRGTAASPAWTTRDITTPGEAPAGVQVGTVSEYQLFSPDLSLAALESPTGTTPLSPLATERTPYLREANGEHTPLVYPGNVPPGTKFGGIFKGFSNGFEGGVEFEAATPDLSHIVVRSPQALTGGFKAGFEPNTNVSNLYEWSHGALELLSQVPSGAGTLCGGTEPACIPAAEAHEAGLGGAGLGGEHLTRDALSADGSRAVFNVENNGAAELFLRDGARGETLKLDANQGGTFSAPETAETAFQDASNDGSRVFFTSPRRLTPDSTAATEHPDLYMCQVVVDGEGHLACTLKDLSVDHNAGEHANVQAQPRGAGIIPGVSSDGSVVYYVADGALAAGAVRGNCEDAKRSPSQSCNLYRYDVETGETRLVAVLSGADSADWSGTRNVSLSELTSRVSPDGRWLAFMSQRPLTGYENRDARTGVRDEEVFLYDSQANGGAGQLVCASCNPTGARPHGVADNSPIPGLLVDRTQAWAGSSLAGSIPAWTNITLGGHTTYQSRYLSDSGRLFFNAADALVPQDSNGTEDVYEFEPPGVGGCTTASATYVSASGGCVGLISSGSSAEESAFMDASENGNDVFFITAAQLSPSDHDSALDVYDAHVCSAALPCPPPPAAPEPECAGDACQGVVAPPSDPTPGSLTFQGPGNLVPALTPPGKPKTSTRAQLLAKALKSCRTKHNRHRRAVCEKTARHRYGPTKAKKAKRANHNRRTHS